VFELASDAICVNNDESVIIFVSDMHLLPEADRLTDPSGFLLALEDLLPTDCSHLFLLGDLFEAWVGDDADIPARHAFAKALSGLRQRCQQSLKLYLMHGNRDFLIGGRFCAEVGAKLMPEPTRLHAFGLDAGLAHGDAFCTDDSAYQDFRRQVRQASWQQDFLAQPIKKRLEIAFAMRSESEAAKRQKTFAIMDANETALHAWVQQHHVAVLIHGHTHRPALHQGLFQRWVLPDWDAKRQRGGWLRWDKLGFKAQGPFGPWA